MRSAEEDRNAFVIRSLEELYAFCAEQAPYYSQTDSADGTVRKEEFLKACEGYSEEYFKDRILVIFFVAVGDGGSRYSIPYVCYEEGILYSYLRYK